MRHVAYRGETKGIQDLVGKPEERRQFATPGVDGSIIFTLLRQDGLLIKCPQFPHVLNTLNVQHYNIFLLTF